MQPLRSDAMYRDSASQALFSVQSSAQCLDGMVCHIQTSPFLDNTAPWVQRLAEQQALAM